MKEEEINMANGVIVESRIQATNIDALNRTAQAQIAVAAK